MLNFFSKQKSAIGLDISDTMLRLMQLEKQSSGFFPSAFSEVPLTKGIIQDSIIKNPEQLTKSILRGINQPVYGKYDSSFVAVSLSESKSFVRVISVPKMSEEEAQEAVPFEAEQYIPLSADQVYMDFQILEMPESNDGKMKVVIFATPKNLVDEYLKVVKNAKLKPFVAEVESASVARSLISESENDTPTLILDISAVRSNLVIHDFGSLQFTSSLPVAGRTLTTQISQRMTISEEEAEKLKQQVGLLSQKDGGKLKEILVPQLHSIVEAVKNAINFYREHSEGSREIKQILLCGGSSKLKGLTQFLNTELSESGRKGKIVVKIGDPWVNVLNSNIRKVPPISKSDSISYTTVIGLALRGKEFE
ncbi:MAG: hypothetical protein COT91_04695 [Candidatus Doudnabacteria bacterium CG10_big_fil_rev_8_21_14_0_10_41_10]|uniref:SHS2 domain-containing protein n=1 Tax=Candidatus Doudnabacteria bacterium CG10_big_fil_rev_8_21_14_0_10_41_10 TaxID=1974551 RepID=A0A2H0VCJ7_9BACT|nr:MAG: hypothetical protein COT91_04695 [Candidatus Doudnabacteria bacterium CG10_big_fil_rev_8_21_14_0_10_41_10]